MNLTAPSPPPCAPTASATKTAKVTVEAAIVAVWEVEVKADDEESARRTVMALPFMAAWDEISLAAARALKDEAADLDALTISNVVAGEASLLVQVRRG